MFMCTAEAPENPAPDSLMVCIISAASVMPRPGTAELGRHGDAEPARIGYCAVEVFRKTAVTITLEPVLRVELFAQFGDAIADGELVGGEGEVH